MGSVLGQAAEIRLRKQQPTRARVSGHIGSFSWHLFLKAWPRVFRYPGQHALPGERSTTQRVCRDSRRTPASAGSRLATGAGGAQSPQAIVAESVQWRIDQLGDTGLATGPIFHSAYWVVSSVPGVADVLPKTHMRSRTHCWAGPLSAHLLRKQPLSPRFYSAERDRLLCRSGPSSSPILCQWPTKAPSGVVLLYL